jgi:hypothetical protein
MTQGVSAHSSISGHDILTGQMFLFPEHRLSQRPADIRLSASLELGLLQLVKKNDTITTVGIYVGIRLPGPHLSCSRCTPTGWCSLQTWMDCELRSLLPPSTALISRYASFACLWLPEVPRRMRLS